MAGLCPLPQPLVREVCANDRRQQIRMTGERPGFDDHAPTAALTRLYRWILKPRAIVKAVSSMVPPWTTALPVETDSPEGLVEPTL